MKKENKTHKMRIRNLVIALSLTAIILSVSTYAWFVGMRTVNVSSFDVEIAATEDLQLSLNGAKWFDTVSISEANYNAKTGDENPYDGNTNWWAGKGLIPMSSVGDIDSGSSRLIMYEKASLTATPGGYRLIASQVENTVKDDEGDYTETEVDGYVAFDLFIKNSTGAQYIEELDELDEEAIYLSVDSAVGVSDSGATTPGVSGTGIENSVRVAFAQIGRVSGDTTTQATITGIDCTGGSDVTGICTRRAQIWEPNDTAHVAGAIDWYQKSCQKRTGSDVTEKDSYSKAFDCPLIANGTAYPTYAVAKKIESGDNVDVYDGLTYNGYTTNVLEKDAEEPDPGDGTALIGTGDQLLEAYPYFSDSHKIQTGTDRPTFMKLAPNSITKIRVYIYIEGQDVDNYDFASIGKSISVKFGFTKQRFIETDFNYSGPTRPVTTSSTTTTTTEPTPEP